MGRYTHIKEAAYQANAQILVHRWSIVAELATPDPERLKQTLMAKHYRRKHGKNAYYGQS